jgi:hypothetical protein
MNMFLDNISFLRILEFESEWNVSTMVYVSQLP